MNAWDTPEVQHTSVFRGGEQSSDNSSIKSKFVEFIRSYVQGGVYLYRDQLRANLNMSQFHLEVNLEHLASFDEPLFELLKQQPNSLLPLFEDAAKTLAVQSNLLPEIPNHFQVCFHRNHV